MMNDHAVLQEEANKRLCAFHVVENCQMGSHYNGSIYTNKRYIHFVDEYYTDPTHIIFT